MSKAKAQFKLSRPPVWPDTLEVLSNGTRIPFDRIDHETIEVDAAFAENVQVRTVVRTRQEAEAEDGAPEATP